MNSQSEVFPIHSILLFDFREEVSEPDILIIMASLVLQTDIFYSDSLLIGYIGPTCTYKYDLGELVKIYRTSSEFRLLYDCDILFYTFIVTRY